jgi:NAD/NADP transhydrogenase alpha subunit
MKQAALILHHICVSKSNIKNYILKRIIYPAFKNILNLIQFDASNLFAKNICTFMEALSKELSSGVDVEKIEDELIRSMLLTFRILIDHEMFR